MLAYTEGMSTKSSLTPPSAFTEVTNIVKESIRRAIFLNETSVLMNDSVQENVHERTLR
jgi:hypothetical protein